MSSALAQKVRDNYEELFPQSKEAAFSRRSQSAWADITSEINAEFGSSISEKQCKEKWHNLKKIAKRENADEQKHRRGTGGGPKRLESKDPALQIITDTMGESASFKGIPGGRSSVKNDEPHSDVSTPTSVEKEEDEDLTPRAKKIPRWEKSGYEKAFPMPPVAEVQRNVLELSVENQKKMSDSLDNFNSMIIMAEFMEDLEMKHSRGSKGLFIDPVLELRFLSSGDRNIELIRRYRFPDEGIDFISNLVKDDLQPKHGMKGNPIPVKLQVMITLQYLASNCFEIQVSDSFNISQRTVSIILHRVTKALSNKSPDFITFQKTPQNESTIKRDFMNYCDLPFVMGAIDCSHIKIEGPGSDEESYINRKGFYSLNMQAVCDMRCKFTNIDLRWPGSTHDSFVLRTSCRLKLRRIATAILAAAVLHNIAIEMRLPNHHQRRKSQMKMMI
ncbi:hypothetical protein niasHT_005892 [Heterodera trifolii]|uniref:Putative nuclease HARBI1 n=1 Tax=Heterodera trifolii TaxID=157864 RepID=A0ABD2LYC5_9BILA